MTAKNKLFTPNGDKKLFTITIEVLENCAIIKVANHEDYKATYHEVIGALDTQKINTIMNQREHNLKIFHKKKKITSDRPN